MKARLIVNRNEGEDVIHDLSNLKESCNTDQIKGRQNVDGKTAAAMIVTGEARACDHCIQEVT